MKPLHLCAVLLVCSGAALAQTAPETLRAPLIGNDGSPIGEIDLRGGPNGSVLRIAVRAGKVAAGWHGMHFHAVGDCSDMAKFEASKAHVNHGGKQHGFLNAGGPDDGDLPNVFAAADGAVQAEVFTANKLASLRDADGSAVILHANADDHASQPIGGAGNRIGCAAIK
jgi:superoxide dismutase, Cu-Zn family